MILMLKFVGCDLYHGKWVYDSAGPLYTNNSCPVLTQMQNCQGNGRPDKEYENWRWKPTGCELPRFEPKNFLELMRGKTLAFIGDSVARNQMESMLCILWQASVPSMCCLISTMFTCVLTWTENLHAISFTFDDYINAFSPQFYEVLRIRLTYALKINCKHKKLRHCLTTIS